jgi:hypothetical protein
MSGDPDPRRATTARRGLYTSLDGSPRGPGDDDDDDDERPIGDPDDDEDYDDDEDEDEEPLRVSPIEYP